jgi:PIN domain nuclease of toxin-antitoxin system
VRLLLDTHAVAWSILSVGRLSANARQAIDADENTVFVSIVSPWEMAIKAGQGKWPDALGLIGDFDPQMAAAGFELLAITVPHVRTAGLMSSPHRDPFDRLLAAQASAEGLTLVTADAKLAGLGAMVLW